MPGKCEHGLTTRECLVCASPKYGERACATPLLDLLRAVPTDARQVYEHSPTEHQNIPFGRLAQEAANEIERLRAQLAQRDKPDFPFGGTASGGLTQCDMHDDESY